MLLRLPTASYNSRMNENGLFRAFPAAAFLVGLAEAELLEELSLAEVAAAAVVVALEVVAVDLAATAANRTATMASQESCILMEGFETIGWEYGRQTRRLRLSWR